MDVAYLENGDLSFRDDYPKPQPGSGEVLLQVKLAGVCGTDIALVHGYASFTGVPGHEFVAQVIGVGQDVDEAWQGQRVVAEINQWCGQCEFCHDSNFSHCTQRRVIGIRDHQGAFAQYLVVKTNTLHRLPEHITDQQAVFIEPLAAAFRIVEQIKHLSYARVLLIGAGRLGQLIARVMALQGVELFVVTRHQKQDRLLQGLPLSCVDEAQLQTRSMDIVIEASGHASGFELALKAVRPTGVCVLKSTYGQPQLVNLTELVIHEIQVWGSRCGPFSTAISELGFGNIEVGSLIEAVYPLSDIKAAFEKLREPACMKVLLRP